jgi:hypothetical protein
MIATHPAFDAALEEVRRRKGIDVDPEPAQTPPETPPPPKPAKQAKPITVETYGEAMPCVLGLPILCRQCFPRRPRIGVTARQTLKGELRARDPRCFYCRRKVGKRSSTVDHVVPRSKGGPDAPHNLVLCCRSCNIHKAALSVWEWLDLIEQMAASVRYALVVDVVRD